MPPEAQFDRLTGIRNWADNYYDIGPEQYTFVPASEFGQKVSPREIVPIERNVTIINQTTNVTNITYNNSVIVDRGPSYDDLRSHSRQPIERFRLERRQDFNTGAPVLRDDVVALPTMDFRPAERAARPNRVVRTIAQPVAERGWTGIRDAPAAQKLVPRCRRKPPRPQISRLNDSLGRNKKTHSFATRPRKSGSGRESGGFDRERDSGWDACAFAQQSSPGAACVADACRDLCGQIPLRLSRLGQADCSPP